MRTPRGLHGNLWGTVKYSSCESIRLTRSHSQLPETLGLGLALGVAVQAHFKKALPKTEGKLKLHKDIVPDNFTGSLSSILLLIKYVKVPNHLYKYNGYLWILISTQNCGNQ